MRSLFVIISGRIYDNMINEHLNVIKSIKNIFNKEFDLKIGLFLWSSSLNYKKYFEDKVDILEFYDSNKFHKKGYIKMFQLNEIILNKYDNFDFYLRSRTDLIIEDFKIKINDRYNSFKWARGITDNIGLANKNIFLTIWKNNNINQLDKLGPEIYLKKKIRENGIKVNNLKCIVKLFKPLNERKPGIRIWNTINDSYLYKNSIN